MPRAPAPPPATAPAIAATAAPEGLPWERKDSRGGLRALLRTAWWVLFDPGPAFASLRAERVGEALVFAVLLGTAGGAATVGWDLAYRHLVFDHPPWTYGAGGYGQALFLGALAALPLAIGFALGGLSLAVHAALGVVGGARRSLRVSFAALAYAFGAGAAVAVVPLIGPALGLFWAVLSSVTGLATVHGTGKPRAVFAVVVPLVVVGGALAMAGLLGWAIVSAARSSP